MTNDTLILLRRIRLTAWATAVAAALGIAAFLMWSGAKSEQLPQPTSSGEAAIHSEFSLTDHTGKSVTEADYLGRWQLVFFGYTYCPDICPTTLAYMAETLDAMGADADRIAPLFVTVDPARDTTAVMAEYVSAFHPQIVGLTGSEEEIAAAADAFRVYYERVDQDGAPDDYLMAHAGHIYLMTPNGQFETVFREGDQTSEDMAREIKKIMNGYEG